MADKPKVAIFTPNPMISIAVETERPPTGLDQLPGVHDLKIQDSRAHFDVDTEHLDATLRRLGTAP